MEKIIELVIAGKVSEALHDLEESLRQICELRKEKKSTKKFLITSVRVFDSLYSGIRRW